MFPKRPVRLSHSIPLAPNFASSGLGFLGAALGRISGGMVPDGTIFKFDTSDFSMMAAQILLDESGLDCHVTGAGQSSDGDVSFFTVSSGKIYVVSCSVSGGNLNIELAEATKEDVAECQQVQAMRSAIKALACKQIVEHGHAEENDSFIGHTEVEAESAILLRPAGSGALVVLDGAKTGIVKCGFYFTINGIRGMDIEEATNCMVFNQMSEEQIAEERRKYSEAVGMSGESWGPMGIA